MIWVYALLVAWLLWRILVFGRWVTLVIPAGSHRPRLHQRVLAAMCGVSGIAIGRRLSVQVVVPRLPFGPHSGKVWGATRGWSWERVRRYGIGGIFKLFHEESDRFTFHGEEPNWTTGFGAYSYFNAQRPYEAARRPDQSVDLGPAGVGHIVTLTLIRYKRSTRYEMRWAGRCRTHEAVHWRRVLWVASILAGPYYGGKEPSPTKIIFLMRRVP